MPNNYRVAAKVSKVDKSHLKMARFASKMARRAAAKIAYEERRAAGIVGPEIGEAPNGL